MHFYILYVVYNLFLFVEWSLFSYEAQKTKQKFIQYVISLYRRIKTDLYVKWSHTSRSCLIRDFRWKDFDEARDLLMTDLWRGRSLWCIWLRWRDTGEWDTWWGDNAAVSMQRVLLLNVNTKEPHWSLLSVTRCPENEGTDSRHNRTERAARASPFPPLFLLVEQRGGDARRSRLWNATSPDPSCTVRIVPTCPACTTEVSRRGARKRRGLSGGGRKGEWEKEKEWEGRNRFIASLNGRDLFRDRFASRKIIISREHRLLVSTSLRNVRRNI